MIKNIIDKEIKDPLAEMIISGEIKNNSAVRVDAVGENFSFDVICFVCHHNCMFYARSNLTSTNS